MPLEKHSIGELKPKLLDLLLLLDKVLLNCADVLRLPIQEWSAIGKQIRAEQYRITAERELFLEADLVGDLQRGGGGLDGTKGSEDWERHVWHLGQDSNTEVFERYVPPHLATSAEPQIPPLLPPSDEHRILTPFEKKVLLAAVYDASLEDDAPCFDPWASASPRWKTESRFLVEVWALRQYGLDDGEVGYVLGAFKELRPDLEASLNLDNGQNSDPARITVIDKLPDDARKTLADDLADATASNQSPNDVRADSQLCTQALEQILVGDMHAICGEANAIFRDLTKADYGIDGELEFRDNDGNASGRKVYVQLKSGDSHLRQRQADGKLIFDVQNRRHLDYWQKQLCDVWLVIRHGHGTICWMNITQYLRDRPNKTCLQIEFDGSPLTASAIRLLGEAVIPPSNR